MTQRVSFEDQLSVFNDDQACCVELSKVIIEGVDLIFEYI